MSKEDNNIYSLDCRWERVSSHLLRFEDYLYGKELVALRAEELDDKIELLDIFIGYLEEEHLLNVVEGFVEWFCDQNPDASTCNVEVTEE